MGHERDSELLESAMLRSSGRLRRSSGLPELTAVGVNIAASEETVKGVGEWLERYGISGSKATLSSEGNCSVASITYSNAEVRYVTTSGARIGAKSVREWEDYQIS